VFFALWPDVATRGRIAQHSGELVARAGGRAIDTAALHLTLVFIGSVPTQSLAAISAAAASVSAPRFTLSLDRLGAWRHNGIGWLAPSHVPEAARELSERLRAALRERSIQFDAKDFKAHITLVRKLSGQVAATTVSAIDWPVQDFVLMRSRLEAGGAGYECAGRWPLQGSS
jgi:RNA 2',3'-cyclic 3'-phosphodiesterase